MKHVKFLPFAMVFMLSSAALFADPAAETFSVRSATSRPVDWSIAKIKSDLAKEVTTISYTGRDGKHTAMAVPLSALLKASGVKTDLKPDPTAAPNVKHSELHYAVTVEGRDGYYTVFSLAELMPDLSSQHVWVALDADGKPLPASESPVKLIAADDQKPARWVHAVQKISIVEIGAPATQPAVK